MTTSKDFEIGGRYTYHTKDECYKVSLKAVRQGYQVRYGKSYTGHYFFEIVDPFESEWCDE